MYPFIHLPDLKKTKNLRGRWFILIPEKENVGQQANKNVPFCPFVKIKSLKTISSIQPVPSTSLLDYSYVHELADFLPLWSTKHLTSSAQCRVSTSEQVCQWKGDSNCFHLRGCAVFSLIQQKAAPPGKQTTVNEKGIVLQTTSNLGCLQRFSKT